MDKLFMQNPIDYTSFCEHKKCPEFVRWEYGHGHCTSCSKIGQSHFIQHYPEDCMFLGEIKRFKEVALHPEDNLFDCPGCNQKAAYVEKGYQGFDSKGRDVDVSINYCKSCGHEWAD
jgi:hypothetical protein